MWLVAIKYGLIVQNIKPHPNIIEIECVARIDDDTHRIDTDKSKSEGF